MVRAIRAIGPARLGFAVLAWTFVVSIIVQVFLVGLDIFADLGGSIHRDLAYVYGWLAPILVLFAAAVHAPRRTRMLTILLLVLFAIQTVLPSLAESFPVLAALHTLVALAILAVAVAVARGATAWAATRTTGMRGDATGV
jgi:hypothetical protein